MPMPGLSASLEYRFLGVLNPTDAMQGQNLSGVPLHQAEGNVDFKNDYNHSIMLGLRYAFGVTPAAAAADPGSRRGSGARSGPHLPGVLRLG